MADDPEGVSGTVGEPARDHDADDRAALTRGLLAMLAAAVVLAGVHVLAGALWPRLTAAADISPPAPQSLNPVINLALYVANLFVLGSLLLVRPRPRAAGWAGAALGYAVIVWLLWPLIRVMDENLLLLVMAVFVYGGLVRRPYLLGFLYLFLLCQRFLPAYLYPSFLLSSLLYATLPPFVRAWRRQRERFIPLCHLAGLILLAMLLIPILFYCTQSSPQDLRMRLAAPEVLAALGTSLRTSLLATLVVLVLGVPLAYAVVRRPFPGRGLIDALIDLPIVVPPPIVGVTLLAFLGPKSPLGAYLETRFGFGFFNNEAGIVIAQVFVGSPYLIRASMVAFAGVDVRYENVARTLGASSFSAFVRVTLPLSTRGILIGVFLTWFRAMGEYGALRVMAEHPRTIPILTYDWYIAYGQAESQPVGVLVLLLCLGVMIGMWIIRSMPSILGRSIGASDAAG